MVQYKQKRINNNLKIQKNEKISFNYGSSCFYVFNEC